MPVRTRDIELRTQRCSIRLFNQIHAACARFHRRLNDRALFDLCHAGRHTDNHAGLDQGKLADFLEELVEHFFGHLIVGNDAVSQRAHRDDIARRSSEHISCRRTDLQHLAGVLVHRNNRRLAQDDALSFLVNQNIRGTQIDTDVS